MRLIGNLDHALSMLKSGREALGTPRQRDGEPSEWPKGSPPQYVSPGRTLAPGGVVYSKTNLPSHSYKIAQSNTIFTQPQFYSPLHTPQNWQIPSKRRAIYQWCRFFVENEPKVGAAIDIYSKFSMNGFELQCDDPKILQYYEHFVKKINLEHWCKMISREYFMLGDVFPFLEIECKVCNGSGITEDGDRCIHPHGTFRRLVVLNPDWVDVQTNVMAEDPVITLLPDDELKRIVWHKQPKAIYDRIPINVRNLILSGRPIPLDNHAVSHLRFNPYPYGTYGQSLIRRLFKVLAYKDKLMTAQWMVAERLIIPVRVVKVGNDERPAGPTEISDVQQQLAQVANDPNLTLVTHHAFEYEWIGTTGKVLQLNNEYEMVNKEILQGLMVNESLLSGEMGAYACYDEETRALTKDGLKYYHEIGPDDEIACVDPETGELSYGKYRARHCYDFDGELTRFRTDRIDIAVTDNHRMLFKRRGHSEWQVGEAKDVRRRARFRKTVKWSGDEDYPRFIEVGDSLVMPLEEYLTVAAYFVTEGYVQRETRRGRSTFGDPMYVHISQTPKGKGWDDMNEFASTATSVKVSKRDHNGGIFSIRKKQLAVRLDDECGYLARNKKVPLWIKALPEKILHKFLMDMVNGDGCTRKRDRHGPRRYYRYFTASRKLSDDVCEIALKCGYYPKIRRTKKGLFVVLFSDYDRGDETITLDSKKYDTISKVPYKGKVWCLTTETGFFVTERGGVFAVQGNSAAIGAEAIKNRMEEWRRTLKLWIEERVFKPIAQMKGFVDEEATKEIGKEIGEPVWIYPKVKWNELHIRDKTQHDQILLQLQERGLVSSQTTLEQLDFDYDQEVERIRYETAAQSFGAMGPGGGMGGPPGGGPAGPGGLEGGMGAEMAGGLGGGMEVPEGPGGMGGPPGMAGPGGAPAPGGAAAGSSGKILTKKRSSKDLQQLDEEQVQPSTIRLTSLEQKMNKMLGTMRLPFPYMAQYPLGPYRADFAIPAIKLAVEVDGQKWHETPEAIAKDKKRDAELAYYGWTVARFGERELKDRAMDVEYTLTAVINDLWKNALERQKKMREAKEKAAVAESHLLKLSVVENLMRSALNKREKAKKAMSAARNLAGKLVQSSVQELSDESLRAHASAGSYPCEEAEAPEEPQEDSDGEADQGTRDQVD